MRAEKIAPYTPAGWNAARSRVAGSFSTSASFACSDRSNSALAENSASRRRSPCCASFYGVDLSRVI